MRLIHAAMLSGAIVLGYTSLASAQAASVLTKVKQDGVLKVCFALGMPESYKDPKTGKWLGVFVDLARQLAKDMNVKLKPVEVQWNTAVLSLKQGDCDVMGSSFAYTVQRSLEVDYIKPFRAKGENAVIRKADTKIKKLSDLNSPDVTIAVSVGTREYDFAHEMLPKAHLMALQFQQDVQTLAPIKRGDADATIAPEINIHWWLEQPENNWAKMAFPGDDFNKKPVGWAIRYGDPAWKNFLDSFSEYVTTTGEVTRLYDEYLVKTNPYQK